MEQLEGNTHSFLFPQNLKFLFPSKLGGMGGNGFKFNEIFVKIPKIPSLISVLFFSFSCKKIQLSFLHDIVRPLQSEATAASLSFSFVCYNFRLLLKPSMSIFFFFFSVVCQSLFYFILFMNCCQSFMIVIYSVFVHLKTKTNEHFVHLKTLKVKRNENCCQSYLYN